jgi:glycosyltransferase involved in cell wall biosynthesis
MNDEKKEGGLRIKGALKSSAPDFPIITIITVVLNGCRYVEQAILSVINQDYPQLEYIVIDGGSTDGTLDIIRKYEDRIDYWVSEPDSGIYDAMNKGIALARGKLIGLLNADDYYEPSALQAVAAAYVAAPTAGIFYGNSYILQEDMGLRYKSYGHTRFWRGMGFPHQAMFVHRAVHTAVGSYDTGYRIAADYDFVLRALADNIPILYVDAPLVSYRNTGLSGSNLYASLNEIRRINRKYFGLLSLAHAGFLLLFAKSCFLLALEKVLALSCGPRVLAWARMTYMKKIIIKGHSPR